MSVPEGRLTLDLLNSMPADQLLSRWSFFEHSPWIVERALEDRPFDSVLDFHRACTKVIESAGREAQLELIRAHPDLVGRLAREGRLTDESTREQAAAGLDTLAGEEIEQFERYNAAYRDRFGFPFVICARSNRKEAILEAFPRRLANDREAEIDASLLQIGQIAWLRMCDAIDSV